MSSTAGRGSSPRHSPSCHRRPKVKASVAKPTGHSSPARDEFSQKCKVAAIGRALSTEPLDVVTLRQLAISSGGLLSNDLRCKAWPLLLGVSVDDIPPKPDQDTLHGHRDYNQVVLDVNRSLKRFPPGMKEEVRMSYQDQLVDVIMRVLVANQELHYYQGYHDICVTFLLVVGEDITFALMNKLSNEHLRAFMDPNMERTKHILNYLYPIVDRAKPELKKFMDRSEVGTIFCLSWLITWFGHVLNDFRHIVRLYDYFIACHPLMPIYLGAAIVLYREKDILTTECEMPYVHSLLSKIPDDLPFEYLASYAGDLFIQFPPEELAMEAKEQAELRAAALAKEAELAAGGNVQRHATQRHWPGTSGPGDQHGNILVRVGVWTITAAVSAALFAMLNASTDWSWFWQ